ncbi:hypothetical protein HU200_005460 [Digitaria exilis]|uniref:Uncharacterized protein n=1 Tax=Digitaria exilis TaxID=1010633 RepID=A0A835FSV8_9POAL|nr:hypothetical protein HU200_005460 [Digitaria exilis]
METPQELGQVTIASLSQEQGAPLFQQRRSWWVAWRKCEAGEPAAEALLRRVAWGPRDSSNRDLLLHDPALNLHPDAKM